MKEDPHLALARVLVCSVIEPGLDGVLLFDPPALLMAEAGRIFEQLLTEVGQRPPRTVVLGSHQSEDDLWTGIELRVQGSEAAFAPAPGPLVQTDRQPIVLFVIPDLARLGLAGQRAVVTLLGAPVAGLERHGHHLWWRPRVRCLAACAANDVGGLSEHLLDRFPIRLPAGRLERSSDGVRRVLAAWSGASDEGPSPVALDEFLEFVCNLTLQPTFSAAAAERVVKLHPPDAPYRRVIALARLARAVARLEQSPDVTAFHVAEAGEILGLSAPKAPVGVEPAQISQSPIAEPPERPLDNGIGGQVPSRAGEPVANPQADQAPVPVRSGGEPVALGPEVIEIPNAAVGPYPEDGAEPLREVAPLRMPSRDDRSPAKRRGAIIGVEPSPDLTDIAWIPTLCCAAKFQTVRRRHAKLGAHGGLILLPTDLSAYRRMPDPERLLTLVLDHTCRRGWNWIDTLASYLVWAYTNRAAVCVVDVGAKGAPSEFRAERFITHSIRDPRVAASLNRLPGRATPLAHGLEMARVSLQHALQHGRCPVSEAWLVIVTDALGNVPLAVSLKGESTGRWTDEGVQDAVEISTKLAALSAIHVVVAPPPRPPHPDLLIRLAAAMGATVLDESARDAF
jgi:magnesium chelatase subunit D